MQPPSTHPYWRHALGLSAALFALGALELSARRDWAVNLYLANKVLGGTALVMVSVAVSLSALRYFWGLGEKRVEHARYFGLVGFGYAVLHVGLTLFVGDPEQPGALKFPFPDYYLEHWVSILCSVAAFGILILLAFRTVRRQHVGRRAGLRRLSYSVVVLGFVHALLLKLEGWETWTATFDPRLPPLSLIAAVVVVALIGIKAAHLVALRRNARRTG